MKGAKKGATTTKGSVIDESVQSECVLAMVSMPTLCKCEGNGKKEGKRLDGRLVEKSGQVMARGLFLSGLKGTCSTL